MPDWAAIANHAVDAAALAALTAMVLYGEPDPWALGAVVSVALGKRVGPLGGSRSSR